MPPSFQSTLVILVAEMPASPLGNGKLDGFGKNGDLLIAGAEAFPIVIPLGSGVGGNLQKLGFETLDERRGPEGKDKREEIYEVVEGPQITVEDHVHHSVVQDGLINHVDSGDLFGIDDKDKRKRSVENPSVMSDRHPHFGDREQFFRPFDQVGQTSDLFFEHGIRDIADVDVGPVATDKDEIPAIRLRDVHFHRLGFKDDVEGPIHVFGKMQGMGDVASRSRRNVTDAGPMTGIHDSVDAFVESSVAADNDQFIRFLLAGIKCEFGSLAGVLGFKNRDLPAGRNQPFDHVIEVAGKILPAAFGIVDQSGFDHRNHLLHYIIIPS